VDPACKWASPLPLNHGYQVASVGFRRNLAIGARVGEGPESTLSRPVLRVLPDKSVMGQVVSRSPFAIDDTGAEALDRFTDFDPSRCPIASKRKPGASFLDRLLRGCRWPDQVRP
jgi:hypothetical protein